MNKMYAIDLKKSSNDIFIDKPILEQKYSEIQLKMRDRLVDFLKNDYQINCFCQFKKSFELFYPYEDIQFIYNFWYRFRQSEYFISLVKDFVFQLMKCDKNELKKIITS